MAKKPTSTMPAHIRAALAGHDVTDVSAMDTGSGGVPRISLKKSKFTAKQGEEETKLGDTINCVIVGISPERGFAKSFYASGYSPTSADAPTCQSDDGVRPDRFVEQPVSTSCATCEKAQWGSAKSMSGGKAKACKDSKRLHIVLEKDIKEEAPTVYILVVTVLSLKPFGAYGKLLAKEGVPTPTVIMTRLSFDEEADVPKLEFEMVDYLDSKQCGTAVEIAQDRPWDSFTPATAITHDPVDKDAVIPKETELVTTGDPIDQWGD